MESAPAGRYKTVKGHKGDIQLFVPEWCFVMLNGERYWTHRTEAGRWNGFTAEQIGDCWHPAPMPPINDNNLRMT